MAAAGAGGVGVSGTPRVSCWQVFLVRLVVASRLIGHGVGEGQRHATRRRTSREADRADGRSAAAAEAAAPADTTDDTRRDDRRTDRQMAGAHARVGAKAVGWTCRCPGGAESGLTAVV